MGNVNTFETTVVMNYSDGDGIYKSLCSPGGHISYKKGLSPPESGMPATITLENGICIGISKAKVRTFACVVEKIKPHDEFHDEIIYNKKLVIGEPPKGKLLIQSKYKIGLGRMVIEYVKGPWDEYYEVLRKDE